MYRLEPVSWVFFSFSREEILPEPEKNTKAGDDRNRDAGDLQPHLELLVDAVDLVQTNGSIGGSLDIALVLAGGVLEVRVFLRYPMAVASFVSLVCMSPLVTVHHVGTRYLAGAERAERLVVDHLPGSVSILFLMNK